MKKIKKLLGIPRDKKVLLVITLGYPAQDTRVKKRKTIEEIISKNHY